MKLIAKVDGWLYRFEVDDKLEWNVLFLEFTSGDGQAGHVSVRDYGGRELGRENLGLTPDPPPWYERGVEHMPPLSDKK